METARKYEPTDVTAELFSDDFDRAWVVKSEKHPTADTARETVVRHLGDEDEGLTVTPRRARIEWRDLHGWWLTLDPEGEYEVWEVSP